jgi:hypothetical protein
MTSGGIAYAQGGADDPSKTMFHAPRIFRSTNRPFDAYWMHSFRWAKRSATVENAPESEIRTVYRTQPVGAFRFSV